ncbi:MAG TPA: hypothetical protein VFQ80_16255, partial [Thermomicrobiales bacterium]|nr:hypothetical protein [Thermomicrobiales bacterium]
MPTHVRLWHEGTRQRPALLPAARVTRTRTLALLTLGLLWASQVALPRIAAVASLGVADPSTERRRRRWLANPAVTRATLWQPLRSALLARLAGQEVGLAFDLTPHGKRFTRLSLGLVWPKRVLPLAWRIMPHQDPWPENMDRLFPALAFPAPAALPAGGVVTL